MYGGFSGWKFQLLEVSVVGGTVTDACAFQVTKLASNLMRYY